MRILCSGGAGFVGSHTVDLLVKRNHKVAVVDNFATGRTENLKDFDGKIYPCDIRDRKSLNAAFKEFMPHAILHLAAQSAISIAMETPQYDLNVNGIGTLNMLEASREYAVSRFVFASSSAVYDERPSFFDLALNEKSPLLPASPYGISKLAGEQYIRNSFPNHMILRYGNIYGPRQRGIGENQVVARAFAHFINGDEFKVVGDGNQKRDFVYVGDIAECNFEALLSNVTGTFNIATGKSHSVNEVLSEIEEIYDVPGYKWEHTPENDPRGDVYLNVHKIRNELGWTARMSLGEGLKLTAEWWEGNK